MTIIILILAVIVSLATIGIIWTLIQKGIPSWIYDLKYNWRHGDYLEMYWQGLFGIVLGITLIGGLTFASVVLINAFCHSIGWTDYCFFKHEQQSEPPAKHIRYDVDSDIDVHTDFVHEGKVIHQEQL